MKVRYTLVLLTLFLALSFTGVLWAREIPEASTVAPTIPEPREAEAARSKSAADADTIRLALDAVETIDPSFATDTGSVTVIEQLFIGLVDIDESGAVQPELATSWTVSPDGLTYTFTLRDDALWSDGTPITASDVRSGLLRALDPHNGSQYAYVLYLIENADAYNFGSITDPNAVGIHVLDDTHLQIKLYQPASYFLSVMGLWVARPVPAHVVSIWGTAWTDPAHIVTSGPYHLSEWVSGDHLLLQKSANYFAAGEVDISQVLVHLVDTFTAWQMYLEGNLDTVDVPPWAAQNPDIQQEMVNRPVACTYYYGFSVSQPPFDNPLVRQAFSAATNRRGLVNNQLPFGDTPALTMTPPGLFGHVDGYAEGVGYPYNPAQARQLLAAAGYPGGAGLPPVTLWYNTSQAHEQIASYVSAGWEEVLGVQVTLQNTDWSTFLQQINDGNLPVFRLGWCADYYDAYNFVGEGVLPHRHGGWSNNNYNQLLNQVRLEADPPTRQSLYRQLEEILVETDAVMIPLYHYGHQVATKPYLERTYPTAPYDIGEWTLAVVSEEIGPAGGTLSSADGDVSLTFPANTFSETVTVTYAPANAPQPDGDLAQSDLIFTLTAVAGEETVDLGRPYTLTIDYDEEDITPLIEETLDLYYWDGSDWVQVDAVLDPATNTLTATLDHFSTWAVLGETIRHYLPALQR